MLTSDNYKDISNFLSIKNRLSLSLTCKNLYTRLWNFNYKKDYKLLIKKYIRLKDFEYIINDKRIDLLKENLKLDTISCDYILFFLSFINEWKQGIDILVSKIKQKRMKFIDGEEEIFNYTLFCLYIYYIKKEYNDHLYEKIENIKCKEKSELLTLFSMDKINLLNKNDSRIQLKQYKGKTNITSDFNMISSCLLNKHIQHCLFPEYIFLLSHLVSIPFFSIEKLTIKKEYKSILYLMERKHIQNIDEYIHELQKGHFELTSREVIDYILKE